MPFDSLVVPVQTQYVADRAGHGGSESAHPNPCPIPDNLAGRHQNDMLPPDRPYYEMRQTQIPKGSVLIR